MFNSFDKLVKILLKTTHIVILAVVGVVTNNRMVFYWNTMPPG